MEKSTRKSWATCFSSCATKRKRSVVFGEDEKSKPDGCFPFPLSKVQSDIEDMIWEVDDDCDKCVNWPEFQAMYHRCRNDKTGAFDA